MSFVGKNAPASIEIMSDAFESGASIPRCHAGEGVGGPAPVPDHGPRTYVFQLFALAAPLPGDRASRSRAQLEKAMAGIVLARGRLDGTYER